MISLFTHNFCIIYSNTTCFVISLSYIIVLFLAAAFKAGKIASNPFQQGGAGGGGGGAMIPPPGGKYIKNHTEYLLTLILKADLHFKNIIKNLI